MVLKMNNKDDVKQIEILTSQEAVQKCRYGEPSIELCKDAQKLGYDISYVYSTTRLNENEWLARCIVRRIRTQ